MKLYWTHKKSYLGLRHFILINELEINKRCFVELVSVLDSNVSLRIPRVELEDTEKWIMGWQELSKSDSITSEYEPLNKVIEGKNFNEIYISERSPFNIS